MKRLIFLFVSVFFVLSTVIVVSYAWFVNTEFNRPTVSGYSAAAYFAAGDGSEEDPYQIATPRHLYNLAWLQYLGQFNKKVDGELEKQYHFEIVQDIDMDGLALPPIGTEENPFVGTLDGNSKTITNLVTTNNMTNLKAHPSGITQIENASIIGFFGIIGNYNEAFSGIASSTVMSASNFYLDNFEVETITENTLIGMAAGYIASNGTIRNIGIHYSWFNMNPTTSISKLSAFDNISNYALVGDYDGNSIEWADKPGSGGPGQDLAYGGNFDVDLLLDRLNLILANKGESPYLPTITTNNTYPALDTQNKMPLTVVPSTITEENYTGPTAKEVVSSQNIGYYIGNQNKINKSDIIFSDPLIEPSDMNAPYVNVEGKTPSEAKETPRQFFIVHGGNGDYAKTNITAMDSETFESLPQNIKELIPDSNIKVDYFTIRLSQRYAGTNVTSSDQNDAWSYQGQINYFGELYGEDVPLYDTRGICLPNNAIWFKPKNKGKLRFVMYSGSDGESFKLIKIYRNSGTKENPFAGQDLSAEEISEINNYSNNLPEYLLMYFEYEVTEEDLENNAEFCLYKGDKKGAYFLYMDIGINGNQEGVGPTPEYTGQIEGVDFVYRTGSGYSDFTDKSDVIFVVSGETGSPVILYFRRNATDGVLYFVDSSSTTITLTPSGSGASGEARNKNCES